MDVPALSRLWQRAVASREWWLTTATLHAVTAVALWMSWRIKAACLDHDWDGFQYTKLCYNDHVPLYGIRGLAEGQVPYWEAFNEYPVLTGLFQYATAKASHDVASFYATGAVWLAVCGIVVTLLLVAWQGPRPRHLVWAAGPPLVSYAFLNWDLLAVALTMGGLLAFHRSRPGWSGSLLGLAAAAKLYPAILLPVLGLTLLRREGGLGRHGWAFGVGAVAAMVLPNLPFLVHDPGLWLETYRFHADRPPTLENPWYVLAHYGARWEWGALARLADVQRFGIVLLLGLGAGLAWLGRAVYRGRIGWLQGAFASLLMFLLINKVYSVQYALWVLPFLAILQVPWRRVAVFLIGDLLVYRTLFTLFLHFEDGRFDPYFEQVALAVFVRAAGLAWMLAWAIRPKPESDPVAQTRPISDAEPA